MRDLKTGYEAIEERARSELGMIRQDEVFFQLQDGDRPPRRRRAARAQALNRRRLPLANGAVVLRITSRNNPRLREVARLIASSRDRRKAGKCVLEGEHLIGVYAERRGAPEVLVVADDCLASSGRRGARGALRRADAGRSRAAVRRARDAAGRRRHPGGGRRRRAPAPSPPAGFCLLLEDVQDPGNVGSMLRSAAAAGVAQVLLSKHCAFAWSPKVLRAAQGAHFHVELHEDVDLPTGRGVRRDGRQPSSPPSPAAGVSLYDAALGGRVALAIGNEGAGLSPALVALASAAGDDSDARRHGVAQRGRGGGGVPVRVRAPAALTGTEAGRCGQRCPRRADRSRRGPTLTT